jgi:hypothetical protein
MLALSQRFTYALVSNMLWFWFGEEKEETAGSGLNLVARIMGL